MFSNLVVSKKKKESIIRVRLKKSVPRITVWHPLASLEMTIGDPREGLIFLSHPHTHEGFLYPRTPDRNFLCFPMSDSSFSHTNAYKIERSLC